MVRKQQKYRIGYTFNFYNPSGTTSNHLDEVYRELTQEQDNWTFHKLLDGYCYEFSMKPFTRKTSWNKDDEEYLFSDGILMPVSTTPKGCILYFDGCNLEWSATPRGIGLTNEDNILIIPRFFLTEDPSDELIRAIHNTRRRGDYIKFGLNPVLLDPCEIIPKFSMGHGNHTSPEAAASCRNVLKNIHEVLFEAIERHIKLLFESRAPPLLPDFSSIKSRLASNEYLHSEDSMKDIYHTVIRYQHASRIVKEMKHRRKEGEQRLVLVKAIFELLGYFVMKIESGEEYVTMESIIPDQVQEYIASDNSDCLNDIYWQERIDSEQIKMLGNIKDTISNICEKPVATNTESKKSKDETKDLEETCRSIERVILVGPSRDFTGFTTDVYQCPTIIMKRGNEHTTVQDIIDTYNLNTGLKIEEILDFDSSTLGEFCSANHDHNPSCLDVFFQFQVNIQQKAKYHLALKRKEVDERSVDELVASIENTDIPTKKKAKKKKKEKKESSNGTSISTAKDDNNDNNSKVENDTQYLNLADIPVSNATQNSCESQDSIEALASYSTSDFKIPEIASASHREEETLMEANLDQEDGFHKVKRKSQNVKKKDNQKKRSSIDKAGLKENKNIGKCKPKVDSPSVNSIKNASNQAPLNRIEPNTSQKQISTKDNEEYIGGARRKTVKKIATEVETSSKIITQTKYSGLSLDEIDVVAAKNCRELEELTKIVKDLDENAQVFMVDMQDKLSTVQTRIDKMEDKTHANVKQVATIDDELNELAKKMKKLKSEKKRIDLENMELKRDIRQLTEERKNLEEICEKDILERKNKKERHLADISKLQDKIKLLKLEKANKERNGKVNGFSEEVSIFHENGHEEENNSQQPQNNALLLEFLKSQIAGKESDLECPVCMEVSQPPIYMCQDQHIICSLCWNKVKMRSGSKLPECVLCRTPYPDPPRHHRYMEKVADELNQLYIMSGINKGS